MLSHCRISGIFLMATFPAFADLNDDEYKEAWTAYQSRDCGRTLALLQAYYKRDVEYLKANPVAGLQIRKVIEYCENERAQSLTIRGVERVGTPPPLPLTGSGRY